jgi:NADPH:quinone reductase-like Zn-dependent oxidoreductase
MKAAVLHQLGQAPRYGELPEPVPQNDDQLIMIVKAASVKNLDKGKASGAHYSAEPLKEPVAVGVDAVGMLEDGTRVYSMGTGMIAGKALINKDTYVKLPNGIDDVTAAALPNAVFGAAAALHFRAALTAGETVLINGATGVTGMVAIQIAKHYGAKKVIATGRNQQVLEGLLQLGADEIISLKATDEEIVRQLKELHTVSPIDVVIDYLWGHPAELILSSLLGKGHTTHRVRIVSVGGMAGDTIQLSSSILRSSDIQISGSGLGSIPKHEMNQLFKEILPEMLQLAADGKLKIETITAKLEDVETAWNMEVGAGKRLVIVI